MLLAVLFIFVAIVAYTLAKWAKNWYGTDTNKTEIPGPKGNLLFGNSFDLSSTDHVGNVNTLSLLAKKYGPIFRLRIFGQNLVYLNSEDIVREALAESMLEYNFNDRPPSVFSNLLNYTGLVAQKDGNAPIYKALRRLMTQGMHIYGEGVKRFEDIVRQELSRFSETIDNFDGEEFEFDEVLTNSLYNIISILLIGEPVPSEDMSRAFREYTDCSDKLLNATVSNLLMMFPFMRHVSGKYKAIFDTFLKASETIANHYFYSMKDTFIPGRTRGIVDFYLSEQLKEQGKQGTEFLSDVNIQCGITDVLSAGSATSKASISGLILCLMNHPDKQKKIQSEIDAIDGIPTLSDKHRCPYTEATIFEALRYLSVAPLLAPRTCKEDKVLHGAKIPKKSIVFVNGWYLWHNEDIWGDPWTFRPERFLDQDGQIMSRADMSRKGLLLFGLGRRRCPGEGLALSRIFLFLTTIMKQWTVLPPKGYKPSCDPRSSDFKVHLLTTPKPYKCIMKKRHLENLKDV